MISMAYSTMKTIEEKAAAVKHHYQSTPYDHQEIRERIFRTSLTWDVLQQYDLSEKKIVDIGCSTSYLGRYLQGRCPGWSYLGIDINPRAVAQAREKGLNVREGNNLNLDLPDNYADLTVSEGVIHHTPDPFRCFGELIRVTKKSGIISLYVYNRKHLYYYVYKAAAVIRLAYRTAPGRLLVDRLVFPLFHLVYVVPGIRIYFKNAAEISQQLSWNIFSDQILTPVAHFFTSRQIIEFAENSGLQLMGKKTSINAQGLMFLFIKL